ncbi:MAG: hypothetical protein JSU00_05685 [Acidobacteria bacterium]|nr:hypothetical protein [Acidobacteriota bacterium]
MGIGGRPDRHALSTAVPPTEIVDELNAFRITDGATVTSTDTFPAGMPVATPLITSSSCATGSFRPALSGGESSGATECRRDQWIVHLLADPEDGDSDTA